MSFLFAGRATLFTFSWSFWSKGSSKININQQWAIKILQNRQAKSFSKKENPFLFVPRSKGTHHPPSDSLGRCVWRASPLWAFALRAEFSHLEPTKNIPKKNIAQSFQITQDISWISILKSNKIFCLQIYCTSFVVCLYMKLCMGFPTRSQLLNSRGFQSLLRWCQLLLHLSIMLISSKNLFEWKI